MKFQKNSIYFIFFAFFLLFSSQIEAVVFKGHPSLFIHEALITRVVPDPIFQATLKPPPPVPDIEKLKTQVKRPFPKMIWIAGYWVWDSQVSDYQWVCGVWRLPPPNHVWIPGFWKNIGQEGWVRVSGFWSQTPLSQLTYISQSFPAIPIENPGQPPGNDFFWNPGFWDFNHYKFVWIKGQWEKFDPNWILVPAHYVWRPEGYIFVPAFWDFPLEKRGVAYRCLHSFFEDNLFKLYSVENFESEPVDPNEFLIDLVGDYPDYLHLFAHHYYFHPDFWQNCRCSPPWWAWKSWWGLSWDAHLALWWWYGHPGYPQPFWVNSELAKQIPPPTQQIVQLFKRIQPPINVTKTGVVSSHKILLSLGKSATRGFKPILPGDIHTLNVFKLQFMPQEPDSFLLPTGRRGDDPSPLFPLRSSQISEKREDLIPKKPEAQSLQVQKTPQNVITTPPDLHPFLFKLEKKQSAKNLLLAPEQKLQDKIPTEVKEEIPVIPACLLKPQSLSSKAVPNHLQKLP